MQKLIFPLLLILFALSTLQAQSLRAYERAGDAALRQKDYAAAIANYQTVLQRKPDNPEVLWKYAECALRFNAYPEAERALRTVADSKKAPNYPDLQLLLGEVILRQGRYAEAEQQLLAFLEKNGESQERDRAKRLAESAAWAKANAKPSAEVQTAGKNVNSPYSDFAPSLRNDTLYFSSYRFEAMGDKNRPRRRLTKMMRSVAGAKARDINRVITMPDSAHFAHAAFSPDGSFLFFNICHNLNAHDIRCEAWFTVRAHNGRWIKPIRLPEPINLSGYTTTHLHVDQDPADGRFILWFASDRPGGKGGLDLWYAPLDPVYFCPCNRPFDNRKITLPKTYAPPVNAAALNTDGNDATPFIDKNSGRIYFSSDARVGYGGYDIYFSDPEDAGFGDPQNAGAGFNSSYDDLYPAFDDSGLKGYLSSNRPGSMYLDEMSKACCHDIFKFTLIRDEPPAQPLAQDPALTPPLPTPPTPNAPAPREPTFADFKGLPLYFDNDEPDKRTQRTSTRKSYDETIAPYLSRQTEYRERFAAPLSGDKKIEAEDAIDDFFENEIRAGFERLSALCEFLQNRLAGGEQIEVQVKGYTSPRARSDYNLNLGKRRVSSVRNFFDRYADGALRPYIESGQLRITELSFGETIARKGVSDDLRDERNSIYHPEAARERRVEIVEVKNWR
ncbi:MAG: tetratricopeptide repeat protein [Saprospiraceae bacterium]